jgi:hypothetical protein
MSEEKHSEIGVWLTTTDNPYDPCDQYDQWKLFDKMHNHDCEELIARFANLSDQLTDTENLIELETAIDEIIAVDLEGVYKKIKKEYTE